MAQISVLIAGCGDLGNAIGTRLLAEGHRVYGLRRNIDQLSTSIQPIVYDLLSEDPVPELPEVDYLIYTAAAKSRDLNTYRKLYLEGPVKILNALPAKPRHCFISGSTGVYAQDNHQWIDETSPAVPNNPFGRILLEGEQHLAAQGVPCTVVRCAGIYGPGRNHLLNRVRAGIIAPEQPLHYSNRIHRDDAAAFFVHLVSLAEAGETLEPVYLACDNEPTPIHQITAWLAEQMGVRVRAEEPIQRGGSKRCSNRRMRESGFELQYPDYRAGFKDLL